MLDNVFVSDLFETWQNCKYKYYLKYVKRLRLPENKGNYELGKTVHALACYYFRGFEVEQLEKYLEPEISSHWDAIKNHPITSNEPVVTEWGFNVNIPGTTYWMNGRIDAIFFDKKNKKYIIADWKTGTKISKEPEKSFQTRIYLYSFFRAQKDLKLDFRHEDLIFQYIKTKDNEDIAPICFSKDKEQEYEEQFRQITAEILNSEVFPKTEIKKACKFCPYKEMC